MAQLTRSLYYKVINCLRRAESITHNLSARHSTRGWPRNELRVARVKDKTKRSYHTPITQTHAHTPVSNLKPSTFCAGEKLTFDAFFFDEHPFSKTHSVCERIANTVTERRPKLIEKIIIAPSCVCFCTCMCDTACD